jgi:hypothetical protein|uniref:hypothetical protein n=1 Tax=Cephaloticoccus sp. TaxID=1985742 RepID=UPI00404979C8
MKTLLAVALFALGLNALAAESLNLRLDIYRFEGEAGLLKDKSPEAQLALLGDREPSITQSIAIQPDGTARSSVRIGVFTLKIDAKINPAKEGAYRIVSDFALVEQIQIGSDTIPSTMAFHTGVSVRLGQRQVAGSFMGGVDEGTSTYQVLVLSLSKQFE